MPFSLIPFILLIIPLLEIGVFIAVGSQIGVFATLGMIVLTAIIGSILLRVQGFGLLTRMRRDLDEGRVPGRELVHGVMILVAGVLLLTPGFVTDTLGFLLFVPALRDAVWRFARRRVQIVAQSSYPTDGPARDSGSPTIDLTEDEYSDTADPDTPWKRSR
ncbi:FxsA family protein [Oricola cellulosilytica]|uniref:Membrane protein FxsA n=1 Tax=Oricola cellulosilytica TaxID=1429082 RepID=A0A4V2MP27_9HYPH|nr:FxsA family protein [Oricola cellulosilytica]TCD15992.1 membrane protein FxsA [Oricola cellulosilytica]